jgi:hypothetical protein
VLEFLHRQHLLIKVRDAPARDCVYRPRRRILAHYRDLLIDDLFASLRQFAGEQGIRPRPSPAADDMAPKG